jgi:hypothetical protein
MAAPGASASQKAFRGFPKSQGGAGQAGAHDYRGAVYRINRHLHGENGRNVSQKPMFLL